MSARLERARLLYDQRRYEQAEQEVGLALAELPDDPLAHALMAMCLLVREQYAEATQHAEEAVGLAPDEAFMHFTLAQVWHGRNYPENAEASLREAISLDPLQPEQYMLLAVIEMRQDRWDRSLEAADAALALDPEHVPARNLRMMVLRVLGSEQSSGDELRATLALAPDDANTHANLAWYCLEHGERDQAMHHFRDALRLDPESEWARHGMIETLKARSLLYRPWLNCFFWIAKRAMRVMGAWWMPLLGAFGFLVAYLAIVEAVDDPRKFTILWPLLAVLVVFGLGPLLAVPLSNLALRLHPFGRLVLSRDERLASNWIAGSLLAVVVAGVVCWVWPNGPTTIVAVFLSVMLLPIGVTFKCDAPSPRGDMVLYTTAVGICGVLAGVAAIQCDVLGNSRPAAALTGLRSFAGAFRHLFVLGAFASLAVGAGLSLHWKK
ncbi:MAG: tetratricopeptide repeat protein [Candidatus Nealsonbacteria bacterium]|nr:tetratricopeptide repeat protein [Candidatus Nealsonbacteria bacterium]